MLLNETPIRTSKNYGINNIELKEVEFPKCIEEFNSLTISGDTSNFEISNQVENIPLTYGNGEELEVLNKEKANKNLKIENAKFGTLNIDFSFNEEDINLLENIEIEAKEKSKTTIIIKYTSKEDLSYFHNGIIRLNAKKDSKTDVVIVNMLNNKSNNFLSVENTLEENAAVNFCIVDFGGKTSITNWYSNLKAKDSKANINTIYLGTQDQVFDINYISELFGEKTETNIEVQGALKDNAKKNFKGTIDFKRGSKKAKGDENEFCMLLSDGAKSKALPMLLCTEEDIDGNHSTSCGKIDEEQLFYIMSRGLSYNDAVKLIVKAKFNKIIETIQDEELKEQISIEIDKRLE